MKIPISYITTKIKKIGVNIKIKFQGHERATVNFCSLWQPENQYVKEKVAAIIRDVEGLHTYNYFILSRK